jgi:holo-[acyl-carrier protein] synthase
MIVGVGTDVVEIERFRALGEKKKDILDQIFSRNELARAPEGPAGETLYATLFAVKEALLKAIGCGLAIGSLWRDIEISGDWKLRLAGKLGVLAKEKSIAKIHVSQSHSDKSAVAFVLLETTNQEDRP